jgi:hypothetical protein
MVRFPLLFAKSRGSFPDDFASSVLIFGNRVGVPANLKALFFKLALAVVCIHIRFALKPIALCGHGNAQEIPCAFAVEAAKDLSRP